MELEQISLFSGALLAIFFAYVPGAKGWYEGLAKDKKQLVMLGALAFVVAGAYGLSCLGRADVFVCDVNGAYDAVLAFVLAVAANAGVYKATNYIGKPPAEG